MAVLHNSITEIAQQSNSVDSGVFVAKWAQHIAEGQQLDFSQKQTNDLRYSLILDIAKGDGFLSSMARECDHSSDDQACPSLTSSGLSNSGVKAHTSSCTNVKGKVQKHHCQSDSDSDFESPKKRPKRESCVQESSSHIPNGSTCKTPTCRSDDHTHAKDAKQADTREEQIPESARKTLPSGYQYKCHEFREIPMDNFTGAPQDSFYVKLSVSNITTKEDVDHWLQQFAASSNIKYNAQGGYK